MRIERLELYGYKRLMLNNINHFTYTPSSNYQIILGTNGSGKSSVLSELSPLPAHSSDFSKDGYKDITITHRGAEYRLVSLFKTGRHSFRVDGEEQNPGGTGEVQKRLVEQHFGLTKELHDLLSGGVLFTTMSPSERRKWITALSTEDYTYGLGVYKKLATRARDATGAAKHLKQRLTQETSALQTLSDMTGLEERAEQLRQELNLLLTSRTPNLPAFREMEQPLEDLLRRIMELSQTVLRLVEPLPTGATFKSIDDVNDELQRLDSEASTTQALLDRYTTEYSDLDSVLRDIGVDGEVTEANVESLMLEAETEIARLMPGLELFTQLSDPLDIQRDSHRVLDEVVEIFKLLPDNTDRRYSRDTVAETKVRNTELLAVIDKATLQLARIEARIAVINSAKDTTCPNCNYIWREGFSQAELMQLEGWSTEHNDIADVAKGKLLNNEQFLEECERIVGLYNRFRGLVSGYPRLQPLWDYILDNKCLTDDPQKHIGLFYTWGRDVDLSCQIDEWRRKHGHFKELSTRQQKLGGASHFNQRMLKLHGEIEDTTGSLSRVRSKARETRQYRDRLLKLNETVESLDRNAKNLQDHHHRMTEALRNQFIDGVVTDHQNDLALIQRQLTDRNALRGIVEDLANSHETVRIDHEAYALLAQELSPDEGLIAEQLTGFIAILVAQLNSVISSVWTYDFSILPCELSSGELDYKFPIQVRSAEHTGKDIGKGSKGMQQIVNLAFQLTVMLYMDLQGYPLYLDEPGEGFDEQHRANLMSFIKQLMDMGHHSQLFMVSHYASNHGAFVNAEVLVLDSSNIAVPGEYNTHVVMN